MSSGILNWVDNTIPIYNLYRNWFKSNSKKSPINLFYQKLVPLLKENGINEVQHPFPNDILKKVLKDLMNETPNNLLFNEILSNSRSLNIWWENLKNYTNSCAVNSMIGHIIGKIK
jgi:serine/threonine-protein kinase SMG1